MEAILNLFLSTFETKIDKKGRISIPARYRLLLEKSDEELMLFSTPESNYVQGCGNNYIKRLWETNLELDQISDEALYIQDILSDSIHAKIDAEGRILLSEKLIENHGIYAQPIFYPTVPKGLERLRITVTPKHRKEHIENMVSCLDKVWSNLSLPRKNSTKLQANN